MWSVLNVLSDWTSLPLPQAAQSLEPFLPNLPLPDAPPLPPPEVGGLGSLGEGFGSSAALVVFGFSAALVELVVGSGSGAFVVGRGTGMTEERTLQRLLSRFFFAMGAWSTWRFMWMWPVDSALVDAGPKETAMMAREERATRLRSLEAIMVEIKERRA